MTGPTLREGRYYQLKVPTPRLKTWLMMIHANRPNRVNIFEYGDTPIKFLPYQLVGSVLDYQGDHG